MAIIMWVSGDVDLQQTRQQETQGSRSHPSNDLQVSTRKNALLPLPLCTVLCKLLVGCNYTNPPTVTQLAILLIELRTVG